MDYFSKLPPATAKPAPMSKLNSNILKVSSAAASRAAAAGAFPITTTTTTSARAEQETNCDRRRPEEQEGNHSRLESMSTMLISKTVTPFLKDHIPRSYQAHDKSEHPAAATSQDNDDRSNTKFCQRHRPDLKCRRAADETKMVMIQSELDKLPLDDRQAITHVWSLFSAAPSKHRDLMLQGIMHNACFPQLSLVAREVQDQLKIDYITALPEELSIKILGYLDAASLCKAAMVCRRWRELAEDDHVWHRICEQHIDRKCTKCGWGLPLLERKRLRSWTKQREIARRQTTAGAEEKPRVPPPTSAPSSSGLAPYSPRSPSPSSTKRDASESDADVESSNKRRCTLKLGGAGGAGEIEASSAASDKKARPWKAVYRDRFKVGSNWKYGRCKVRTFKGHSNGVTCLQLDDNILVTGSYDSSIKIWNIETGQEIRTLSGHTRGIRSLQFDDRLLVSASLDNTVKVWNWHTGDLLNTLAVHSDGVLSVHFEGGILATGSKDKTARVFNLETRESFCLRGHDDWVNQVRVCMASRTLLSASDDTSVKLWDLDSRKCIRTFTGHVGHVQQVLALPPDFEPDEDPASGNPLDNSDAISSASGRCGTPAAVRTPCAPLLPVVLAEPIRYPPSPPPSVDNPRAAYGPGFDKDLDRPLPARYILTGALDSCCKLWDTTTGRCLKTWFGHLEGVWALAGDTLRVVTGAQDGLVKVWEPRSGRCERTFTGHRGPVSCVGLSDSSMASGSEDGEVRFYSFHDIAGLEEWGTPS